MRLSFLIVLGLSLVASCGGGSRPKVSASPVKFPAYPTLTNNENVWAEAIYFTNHEDIFETDLTRRGYLPVGIHVGIRGEGEITSRLTDSTFDPHLYLQDGTVLGWKPADEVERDNKRLRDRINEVALGLSLLQDWDSGEARFVFFKFDTDKLQLRDTSALTREDGIAREVDLLQSLVAFTVETESGPKNIFVGLKSARWKR